MTATVGPVGAETQAAKELIAIRVSAVRFILNPVFIDSFIPSFISAFYLTDPALLEGGIAG
jgi:hypothetical protein